MNNEHMNELNFCQTCRRMTRRDAENRCLKCGMMEMDKAVITNATMQGAILQKIQMDVWEYMLKEPKDRDGVALASNIYDMVRDQVIKELEQRKQN